MSYFDDASLVMIPSGYKTSKVYSVKPTDGSGDLTFSRSNDTATRVNSAGLIEKVRTNLVLSSNNISTQSTYWNANQSGTTTQNAAVAPDGTTTAALITPDGVSSFSGVAQSKTFTAVPQTYSVYLKTNSATANVNVLAVDSASNFFGLTAITINTTWTRYTLTFTPAAGAGNIYITSSGSTAWLAWGAQLETGDIATNLIATTSAAVSVGPVANVPRLDYLNSSCPRLLLEPQRTNLVTYSEQLDNAVWGKINVTISANNTTSPDGYVNADKYTKSATGGSVIYQANKSSATANTFSIFAKNDAVSSIRVGMSDNGNTTDYEAIVNLASGTIISTTAGATSKIENYGNGWYRISITRTSLGDVNPYFGIPDAVTGSFFAYGCQLEAGAYATSYIPTLGAAVTRGADAASKTSASALIGQTEGTLFAEFVVDSSTSPNMPFFVSAAGVFDNAIWIQQSASDSVIFRVFSGTTAQCSITKTGLTNGQTVKVAGAYKANDFVLYVNGVQVGTDNSGSIPSSLSRLEIGSYSEVGSPYNQNRPVNQALLFKTRLTNAQLAELTTL